MTTVLVIEDEPTLLESIVESLSFENMEALGACNGRKGVEMTLSHQPDLIICDVMMPELDGYGVLNTLRANPSTAAIPFIFLTAKAKKSDWRTGMEQGADDYLTKPFTHDALVKAIKTQITKRQQIKDTHDGRLDELRESLIHTLPHELLTPLTGILSSARLLTASAADFSTEELEEVAGYIEESGNRLHDLIKKYLLYAQIELYASNPHKLELLKSAQCENPEEVIHSMSHALAAAYARPSDLYLDLDATPVRMSKHYFAEVIKILVDNAFKFSQAGTPVQIQTRLHNGYYLCQVQDKGRGMTFAQLKEVNAYMQFERDVYEQQGVGLGLITAKRCIELHEGKFMILSKKERGTQIRIAILAA